MSDSVGIGSLTWLIIIALALAGIAYALYRWRARPFGSAPEREDFMDEAENEGRLEVLESTPVDAQRRLVLVRCDNVEHLIMVGGPADLVVESDVRKSRSAVKGSARPATETTGRALALPTERAAPERAEPAAPRRSEPAPAVPEAQARPEARPAEQRPQIMPEQRGPQQGAGERKGDEPKLSEPKPAEPRTSDAPPRFSAASRPTLTAVPGAAIQPPGSRKDGGGAAAPAARDGRNGEAAPRPHAPELPAGGRREPQFPNNKRAPAVQPAPANANRSDERGRGQPAISRDGPAAERRPNGNGIEHGGAGRTASLPPADVPWHEPDSVENEIGRALAESNGSQASGSQNGAPVQPPAAAAGKSDPATTLGDLAERLEEALAREVQSANQGRSRLDPNVDTFSFDREAAEEPAPDGRQGSGQPERREPPKVMAPAPEPELRREARPQPERQEDAPVISLHGRRKEAVDPLEDEMARLLGELTGDTNRR